MDEQQTADLPEAGSIPVFECISRGEMVSSLATNQELQVQLLARENWNGLMVGHTVRDCAVKVRFLVLIIGMV